MDLGEAALSSTFPIHQSHNGPEKKRNILGYTPVQEMDLGLGALSMKSNANYSPMVKSGYRNQWEQDLPVYDAQTYSIAHNGIGASTSRYCAGDYSERMRGGRPGFFELDSNYTGILIVLLFAMIAIVGYLLYQNANLRLAKKGLRKELKLGATPPASK